MERKSQDLSKGSIFSVSDSATRWEKSLAVKDQEVQMISSSNEQLRRTITLLEAEMHELSNALLAKEATIHSKDRDIKKKDDEIRKLVALEQQDKGKERAIEMASTQNGQLLALLDAHEAKSKRLTEDKARLSDELKDSNQVHIKHVQAAAKIESELRSELSKLHRQHTSLQQKYEALVERHSGFEEMVKKTERDCRASVSVVEEELSWRRDEQYVSLMKVQSLEDKLRKSQDLAELHQSQYLAFAQRAEELEQRLDMMMKSLLDKDHEMGVMKQDYQANMELFNNQVLEKDKVEKTLRKSINELSSSLLKVVSKNHELAASLETKTQQLVAQKIKTSEAANRGSTGEGVDRLLSSKKSNRKLGASRPLTQKEQEKHVTSPRTELSKVPPNPPVPLSQPGQSSSSTSDAGLNVHEDDSGLIFMQESHYQTKVLKRYLKTMQLLHTSLTVNESKPSVEACGEEQENMLSVSLPRSSLTCINLKDCLINDNNMHLVVEACLKCGSILEEILLCNNKITDSSVGHLNQLMSSLPRLKLIDLRKNRLSMDAIRALALHLESQSSKELKQKETSGDFRGSCSGTEDQSPILPTSSFVIKQIDHVYIHQDGLIEGLGVSWNKEAKDRKTDTLMALDIRENFREEISLDPSQQFFSNTSSRHSSKHSSQHSSKHSSRHSSRPVSREVGDNKLSTTEQISKQRINRKKVEGEKEAPSSDELPLIAHSK